VIFFVSMMSAGTVFGLLLSRSGAADYDYIQAMFLFENEQLYGILCVAVAVAALGLWLIKRSGRTASGQPLDCRRKPSHSGNIYGGLLFGVGWSMTGMCPGPILVNIGEGKLYAISAFAGAVAGVYTFGALYPRLQRWLHLPSIEEGPGQG